MNKRKLITMEVPPKETKIFLMKAEHTYRQWYQHTYKISLRREKKIEKGFKRSSALNFSVLYLDQIRMHILLDALAIRN